MKTKISTSRKIKILLVGIMLVMSSCTVLPQTIDASDLNSPLQVIKDTLNLIKTNLTAITAVHTLSKDTVLDPLAWVLSKTALQSVVKSMVNSVNKGPSGSPSFVTNLNTQLQAVSDTAANNFISQLSSNGSIKSPFQTAVASSVSTNYLQGSGNNGFFTQNAYTLNKTTTNDTAFFNGDFTNGGGLTTWMSAWSNPANNPFGASALAQSAVNTQVASAQAVQQAELNYGQGFLASRGKCPTTTTGGTTAPTTASKTSSGIPSIPGIPTSVTSALTSLSPNSTCQSSNIQTPGSTIKASLDKTLGSGVDTLVNAHQFDEIINAVLGQLINQVVGSGGLAGTSQPTTSTVVNPVTGVATTTSAATYFDTTDPSQVAISNQLITSFGSTLSDQISQFQTFNVEWTTLNNAALAAQSALLGTNCYPNAQAALTNVVQPVLTEASTSFAEASSSIAQVQQIQAQLPPANGSTDQTSLLSTLTTQYYNELPNLLPSDQEEQNALTQSTDTSGEASTTVPESLLTQLNQLTQAVQQSCLLIKT